MSRWLRAATAVAVFLTVLVEPGASGAAAPRDCSGMALSPEFAKTRSVLCARMEVDDSPPPPGIDDRRVEIWLSKDAGRTWRQRGAVGFTVRGDVPPNAPVRFIGSHITGVLFSALYADDATMYVGISGDGLYASTDEGDTWRPVDPLADGPGFAVSFTPYADYGTLAAQDEALAPIAYLHGAGQISITPTAPLPSASVALPGSARIDPPSHRLVSLPVMPIRVEFPPTRSNDLPALFTGYDFDGSVKSDWVFDDLQTALYACDYDLACSEHRYTFPDQELVWVAASPSYQKDRTIFAISRVIPSFGEFEEYDVLPRVSRDGGRTFAPWKEVERLLAPIRSRGGEIGLLLTSDPDLRRRLIVHVSAYWPRGHVARAGDPPTEQFFVSDDLGRTWRRTGWQNFVGGKRTGGTLPWRASGGTETTSPPLVLAADGRLFFQPSSTPSRAFLVDQATAFCSLDGGVRWSWPCAR